MFPGILVPAHHVSYGRFSPIHLGGSVTPSADLLRSTLTNTNTSGHLAFPRSLARGKYYCEFKVVTINSPGLVVGLQNGGEAFTNALGASTNSYAYTSAGLKGYNASYTAYGASYTTNDVIGLALDLDNQTLTFYKNNTSQGATGFTPSQGTWYPSVSTAPSANNNGVTQAIDLRINPVDWSYAPPSGFGAFGFICVPPPICEWNPSDKSSGSTLGYENRYWGATAATTPARATRFVSTGKWYWEVMITAAGAYTAMVGFGNASASISNFLGSDANGLGYFNATYYKGGSSTAYGANFAVKDIIGVALDCDGGTVTFYKNNVSQGAITHGITGPFAPMISSPGTAETRAAVCNFHRSQLYYTPPTNYNPIGGG